MLRPGWYTIRSTAAAEMLIGSRRKRKKLRTCILVVSRGNVLSELTILDWRHDWLLQQLLKRPGSIAKEKDWIWPRIASGAGLVAMHSFYRLERQYMYLSFVTRCVDGMYYRNDGP